ncbi:alpha/beta hydrolase [Xenophilus sp. Marseille-Q4582]|uniref:alpha/beta hydrolase n=1 Tax=Xenophilus sp. Marseille-Q4582 TaxID=2866600 RepID=UPI001CE46EF9|nr:dienelactone hydrolase family protein [Xenophilus sp. Marseille-Q4582]
MSLLPALEFETGPHPRAAVLLMHGLGADGGDFAPLVPELAPVLAAAGGVRFVFPHAPQRPVTVNGGYVMPAWYDILGPGRPEDEAGLRASRLQVEALIAREKARGLAANRIVLAGFSQGCAMALLTGLRHEERLAGIVGLSGYLPLAASTAAERHPANAQTPVFLAHGSEDAVVVPSRADATREALQALGQPVEWHSYPMGHSVCPQEIADLGRFLARVLG